VAANAGVMVPEGTLAAVDEACGAEGRAGFILAAVARALEPSARAVRGPGGRLAGGTACGGVACGYPGCWLRDTARYGDPLDHGGLVLCAAHAHAVAGAPYQRPGAGMGREKVR